MKSTPLYVHFLLLAVNLIYAGNFTIAKIIMPEQILPFGFIIVRVAPAVVIFWLIWLVFGREKIDWRDLPRFFAAGMFGVTINMLFFFKGLSLTTEINGAVMMITAPILVFILSSIILKERVTWLKTIGIILGFLGAVYAIAGKNLSFQSEHTLGNLFVLLNAASYGMYLVTVKPLMKKYKPITAISMFFTFGLIPILFVGWNEFTVIKWSTFGAVEWWCVFYVVMLTTVATYLMNITALSKAQPSTVGAYIYAQPVLAAGVAIAFGKDTLTWQLVISALIIFAGVYLCTGAKRLQTKQSAQTVTK